MMDSERNGLWVGFAFFQWKNLPDGRVNETVATVEQLSDLCKPGALDGNTPLWWTVIAFKCSFLFQLFDFYCLLVQYSLFFEKKFDLFL